MTAYSVYYKIIMKLFIQIQNIAETLGENFSLFIDLGVVTPSEVTRSELINGIELFASNDSASQITIMPAANNSAIESFTINKEESECVNLNLSAIVQTISGLPDGSVYLNLDAA